MKKLQTNQYKIEANKETALFTPCLADKSIMKIASLIIWEKDIAP